MPREPMKYFNRELSWLEFNQRVLDEANDESVPLLERMKFLAITSSNLDEFFMVRVGGLQILQKQGSTKCDPAGMTASEQLDAISLRVNRILADQCNCLLERLQPALADAGIRRVRPSQLTEGQRKAARRFFDEKVFGIFTPMAIDATEEFPLLINQTLNLCVQLAPLCEAHRTEGEGSRFAIVPLGQIGERFVRLPSESCYEYMLLEDLIAMHTSLLFHHETVVQCVPFRITRNADLSVREDMASDLLASMEDVLEARTLSDCVRLEISDHAHVETREFLQTALEVCDDFVDPVHGPLDLGSFMQLACIPGFETLKYEAWPPRPSPDIDLSTSMFEVIRERDISLSLPYESVEPLVQFIDEAADDPSVLSIKIILYRTSRHSPIVRALARAAGHNKHVTALVELKARFDEARNIEWAKSLEQAGVQVIYGVKGLKTHGKVCIITRNEPHGIQRYVHFSTGNYNEVTARLYSDVAIFTCNPELAADATSVFNAICGYSQPQKFQKIALAPIGLRDRLLELIEAEVERKQQGQNAHIMAQLNSLADPQIIDSLYKASQAGVKIELNVRGICCLRPGVPDLSNNISAVSILDRFLEHSRIIYFHHGGDELVFISSADWMPRNLDRRVELLIPVEDPACRDRLIAILLSYHRDNVKARKLLSEGGYMRPAPPVKERQHRHQEHEHQLACEGQRQAERSQRTTLVPHRATNNEAVLRRGEGDPTLAEDR